MVNIILNAPNVFQIHVFLEYILLFNKCTMNFFLKYLAHLLRVPNKSDKFVQIFLERVNMIFVK